MHSYNKEIRIHFSLFNCSFKLSGGLDILILPCGALNFNEILALQKLRYFVCFLSGENALFYLPH